MRYTATTPPPHAADVEAMFSELAHIAGAPAPPIVWVDLVTVAELVRELDRGDLDVPHANLADGIFCRIDDGVMWLRVDYVPPARFSDAVLDQARQIAATRGETP